MIEPNPYQPPSPSEPVRRLHSQNERLSTGMILLLAPVASYVALFFSSTATWLVIYARQRAGTDPPTAVMSIVLCGPPLVTFLAMIGWAWRVHLLERSSRRFVR